MNFRTKVACTIAASISCYSTLAISQGLDPSSGITAWTAREPHFFDSKMDGTLYLQFQIGTIFSAGQESIPITIKHKIERNYSSGSAQSTFKSDQLTTWLASTANNKHVWMPPCGQAVTLDTHSNDTNRWEIFEYESYQEIRSEDGWAYRYKYGQLTQVVRPNDSILIVFAKAGSIHEVREKGKRVDRLLLTADYHEPKCLSKLWTPEFEANFEYAGAKLNHLSINSAEGSQSIGFGYDDKLLSSILVDDVKQQFIWNSSPAENLTFFDTIVFSPIQISRTSQAHYSHSYNRRSIQIEAAFPSGRKQRFHINPRTGKTWISD